MTIYTSLNQFEITALKFQLVCYLTIGWKWCTWSKSRRTIVYLYAMLWRNLNGLSLRLFPIKRVHRRILPDGFCFYYFVIVSADDSDRGVNKLFVYLDLPPILKIVNQFQDWHNWSLRNLAVSLPTLNFRQKLPLFFQ